MSQVSKLIVRIQQEGGEQLKKLETNLQNVGRQATSTNINFKQLNNELKTVYSQSSQSINSLKAFSAAFREVANNTDVTSQEFFEAKTQADLLDQRLAKLQQTNVRVAQSFKDLGASAKAAASQVRTSTGLIRDPLTGAYRGTPGVTQYDAPIGPQQAGGLRGFLRGKGGVGRLAKIGGGVAAAGIFGGPEGALGAGIGGLLGGPLGAATGGAIGAQLGMLRQQAGALAEYAAALEKQRIALRGVTGSASEYQKALSFIDKTSRDFAIPQDIITKQFTRLSASVIGAGGSVADAEVAFKGIAAGIRGTGGDLRDLDAALTATSQVFSKGKVSAEELRQQIGERLPGAFTLFAESLGKTPQQLDKALELGQVSLQDFQEFAKKLFEDYGETAKIIADSPEAAGDRLQTSLKRLSESIGTFLKPIGAAFQQTFADIADIIDKAARKLADFLGLSREDQIKKLQQNIATTRIRITAFEKRVAEGGGEEARENLQLQQNRLVIQEARLKALQAIETAAARKGGEPRSGLPGITEQTKKAKAGKEIKDITDAELVLYQQIDLALENNNKLQAVFLKGSLQILQTSQQLQRGEIGRNEAQRQRLATRRQVVDAINQERDAMNALGQKVEEQRRQDVKTIEDLQIQFGIIGKQKAEELLLDRRIAELRDQFKYSLLKDDLEIIIQQIKEASEAAKTFGGALSKSFADVVKTSGDLAASLGSTLGNAFLSLGDQLAEFVTTGKASFNDFARSVLDDLTKIFLRFAMFSALKAVVPAGSSFAKFLGFADGGIMTANGPVALKRYARGGIANSPQLAMFGEGSMPEAYVPLPDGRSIPVSMKGGESVGNVVVNVDATGTSVQGNQPDAAQLGRAIGAAVQAELIKQKRPGGLLR